MKQINLRILPLIILVFTGLTLFYLVYDLNNTKNGLAESLLKKPIENAEANLNSFFKPVESTLLSIRDQTQLGLFDSITPELMNRYFGPVLNNYAQISSVGIANTDGYEFDIFQKDAIIYNRVVWIDKWGMKSRWSSWKNNPKQGTSVFLKEWEEEIKDDPRDRLWFTGAMNAPEGKINWTKAYVYNTNSEVGITASISWFNTRTQKQRILALDLTLSDITKFTQSLEVSPRGKLFILTNDGKYIGLPRGSRINSKDSNDQKMLEDIDGINVSSVSDAYKQWETGAKPNRSFEFTSEGNAWWGKLIPFNLSPKNTLLIGVVIPESDILSQVNQTKSIIIGCSVIIFLLIGFILYSYVQSRKLNLLLSKKNKVIHKQKNLIQEKSNEIIDSINYAKRIQTAMLPREHEIKAYFPTSFIFYKPKDIVAGDFYWLEESKGWQLFAVADCTGHGVPGAMVSIVCKNQLNQAVQKYNETDPAQILNITQKLVVHEFEKSSDKVTDGMDIALCALKGNNLKFAGANNPLWVIRKGAKDIEEYKGCKQPIGQFDYSTGFKCHEISLNKGDQFYLFSDGFAAQFGGKEGKKFKTYYFKKLLISISHENMQVQKELIKKAFEDWKNDQEQVDDICIAGVRI